MYYNIASRVLPPVLRDNYELVAGMSTRIQQVLNDNAGFHMKALRPDLNEDRVKGLVNLATSADQYEDKRKELEADVVNFSQRISADGFHKNAEFQYTSGFTPKIRREAESGCCKWCQALEGTYDYADVRDTGNDVWRRHRGCKCIVEYDPGTGRRQNAHAKTWSQADDHRKKIEDAERMMEEREETQSFSMQRNAETVWKGIPKPISVEEFIDLDRFASNLGIVLDPGFKSFDGDVGLVKDFLTTLNKNLDGRSFVRNRKVRLAVSYTMSDADYAITNGATITINGFAYRDREKLKDDYKARLGEKWFTAGSTYLDIGTHESAHVIVYLNQLRVSGATESVFGLDKSNLADKVLNNISKYALESNDELVAESYVAYRNGSKNEYVLKVIEYSGILK